MLGFFKENLLGNISEEEFNTFLKSEITNLEEKILKLTLTNFLLAQQGLFDSNTLLQEKIQQYTNTLADLYLDYAFQTYAFESVVYAHRAVALNPNIKVVPKRKYITDSGRIVVKDEDFELDNTIHYFYSYERSDIQIVVFNLFLNLVKAEARQKGSLALQEHEHTWERVKKGEITDACGSFPFIIGKEYDKK